MMGDTRAAVTWWWWRRRRADTWWWWCITIGDGDVRIGNDVMTVMAMMGDTRAAVTWWWWRRRQIRGVRLALPTPLVSSDKMTMLSCDKMQRCDTLLNNVTAMKWQADGGRGKSFQHHFYTNQVYLGPTIDYETLLEYLIKLWVVNLYIKPA